jgi:stage IV sporulation protein FB
VNQPLFVILGIPVYVELWHVLTLLMVFQGSFQTDLGWMFGVGMLLAGSLSVFLHEMGHALTSRSFGLRPTIVLAGFGGFTQNTDPPRRPRDEFLLIAAGPSVNFAIAAVLWALSTIFLDDGNVFLARLALQVRYVNIFWGIYNLLPIMPMDGGQLMRVVLRKVMKKGLSADRWTYRIGLGLAGAFTLYAISPPTNIWMALILGMAAFQNYRMLQGVNEQDMGRRADRPHPRVGELLTKARDAFEGGQYEAAMRFCHQARAEPELSPAEIRHTWHILAIAAAQLGDWEDAIRFAERVPNSAEMAQVQATGLLSLHDAGRIRVFLGSPAARLLKPERIEELKAQMRGTDS